MRRSLGLRIIAVHMEMYECGQAATFNSDQQTQLARRLQEFDGFYADICSEMGAIHNSVMGHHGYTCARIV